MKALDLKSILVAGAIGAAVLYLITFTIEPLGAQGAPAFTPPEALGYGFAIGATVQIGVRLVGVS